MSKEITGVVTWLKGWFFDKGDIISKEQALQTQINNKASVTDLNTTNGNVSSLQSAMDNKVDKVTGKGLSTNDYTTTEKNKLAGIATGATKTVVDSALSSTSTNPVQNKVLYDILNGTASADDVTYVMDLIDGLSDSDIEFTNNNRLANEWGGITVTNLKQFSNFILDQLVALKNIDVVKIVSTKPTASASTMNKLYVVSENNKVNIYYTEQNGTSYSWHKMDSDILDDLSIDWSEIENNPFNNSTPSSFATAGHSHGYILNDGTLSFNTATIDRNIVNSFAGATLDNKTVRACAFLSAMSVKDTEAHSNIGSNANVHQNTINTQIDTAIGNLQSSTITSISLVPKSTDDTGKIIFYTGDEPT